MRTVVRELDQLDPIWALRTDHIHYLLCSVVEYWSDELKIPAVPPKGPLSSKTPDRAVVFEEARQRRIASLQQLPHRPILSFPEFAREEGMQMLYLSVLWEALRDWADHCFSPFAVDQKKALQAYWWIMGLPPNAPTGMTEDAWKSVACGQRRKHKVAASLDNPLPALGLSITSLFVMRNRDAAPPALFDAQGNCITFLTCCAVTGMDPLPVRRYAHTLHPEA